MRKLSIPIVMIILLSLLSCGQAGSSNSKELEQQIAVEAQQFEELLTELSQHISSMKYPHDIPLEPLASDKWIFKYCETGTSDKQSHYVLCIPVPRGIKTGFTVVRSSDVDYRIYYQRLTYLDPKTDFYLVSSMPDKNRYAHLQWETPPPNFLEYPRKETIDCLSSHMVVLSPYYIPENITHGFYSIDGPESFSDRGNNYNMANLAGDLFDANPYEQRASAAEYQGPQLEEMLEQMRAQIALIDEDTGNALDFVDSLEKKYFQPNADMWNSQDELAQYRESMEKIRTVLSQLETYLQKIDNWDFSSISSTLEN